MMSNPVVVTVCTSCRAAGVERDAADGKAMFEALQAAAAGEASIVVRPSQCLSVCKRVCTVALSSDGRYTFLFGDLDPARDAQAVIDMARSAVVAPHGFVPWKERPEALRNGLVARIPPVGWSPEDGSAPA
ncbi:MAG: DUF1636 family protein [Beijerinckiaceae bacterium]